VVGVAVTTPPVSELPEAAEAHRFVLRQEGFVAEIVEEFSSESQSRMFRYVGAFGCP
jgi:hypothetical protein